jgi:hypothetical protein
MVTKLFLSFLRKQESICLLSSWIPAYARMTHPYHIRFKKTVGSLSGGSLPTGVQAKLGGRTCLPQAGRAAPTNVLGGK